MKTLVSESQGDLFSLRSPVSPHAGLHHRGARPTEVKAALAMVPKAGTQNYEVLRVIANASKGRTRWEVTDLTGILRTSVCRCFTTLERNGYVKDSGRTRQGPMGAEESVYIPTDRGRRFLREQSRRRAS